MKISFTLLGSRGFIGSSLLSQMKIDRAFNRDNLQDLDSLVHDHLIFCSAPAEKWKANLHPEEDLRNLEGLVDLLRGISIKKLVLISTVDVFNQPVLVNELSVPDASSPNFYGMHRLYLEDKLRSIFPDHLVVRLPGLVGKGLRKNALFDLKMANNVHQLNPDSIFQFYPMKNLSKDISIALKAELDTIHLSAEPIKLGTISQQVFQHALQPTEKEPVIYDFRTVKAELWESDMPYQYSALDSLKAIREFAEG
jgi:dTDP-4-dehydrorhamnose reductase